MKLFTNILVFLFLVTTSTLANAKEWLLIGEYDDGGGVNSYIDIDTVKVVNDRVYVWNLMDFNEPQPGDFIFNTYLSAIGYLELDCQLNRLRGLEVNAYSENMGKGKIRSVYWKQGWYYPQPGTSEAAGIEIGCALRDIY